MPALSGTDQWTKIYDSYAGPWCFCKDPAAGIENSSQYCAPALETPEQINLQCVTLCVTPESRHT